MMKRKRLKIAKFGKSLGKYIEKCKLKKTLFYTITFLFLPLYLCFGENQPLFPETKIVADMDSVMNNSPDFIPLQKGIYFLKENQLDSARRYFLESSISENVPIKVKSFFYLNFIEIHLGNYEQSIVYLEQYHNNAIIIYNQANEDKSNSKQQEELQKILSSIKHENKKISYYIGVLIISFIIVVCYLLYLQNKKEWIFFKQKKEELKKLDATIHLKKEKSQTIGYNNFLIEADVFKKSPVYSDIKHLTSSKKDTKVLTYAKQKQLETEIENIFPNFIQELKNSKSNLTSNDIKLCCLSLLPLTTLAKALCFGSTETNIIKQRKHIIKKKMTKESDNVPLFNFIFTFKKNDDN